MGLCNRWLRIFINQLLDAMERDKTTAAAPVLVCLDEFPVLGHMPPALMNNMVRMTMKSAQRPTTAGKAAASSIIHGIAPQKSVASFFSKISGFSTIGLAPNC